MAPSKRHLSPLNPEQNAIITIELSQAVYGRVVEAAAYSKQSLTEWVESMCDTATIH
jgi:hypothetical protein